MRNVSPEEIKRRIDIAAILPVMRDALRAEAEGRVEVPLRAGWRLGGGDFGMLAMPARSEELKFAAFKFLTLVDGNRALGIPGVMGELTVLDAITGTAVARLPAEEVTLLRTAGCSAVATDLLAPRGADSLALFGSGPQAAHHAAAMLAVRPIKRILVCGRDPGRAARLAAILRSRFGVDTVDRTRCGGLARSRDHLHDHQCARSLVRGKRRSPQRSHQRHRLLSPGHVRIAGGAIAKSGDLRRQQARRGAGGGRSAGGLRLRRKRPRRTCGPSAN